MVSDNPQAIVPKAEKVVDFYGDQIPVAQGEGEEVYVPLRPLATFLGLDQSGQRQRISRDPVMAKRSRQVLMRAEDGRVREQLCLPLDLLPGWLFSISTARVSEELQEKLNRYREEAFRVLWRAFRDDILPSVAEPTGLTPAQQMLEQARAVYQLAQQMVDLENRHNTMADYMRGFVRDTKAELRGHDERLSALEVRLDPAANITEEEATQLRLAVANVARAMGDHKSDYGAMYGELYRRFRITTYHNLPRAKFDEAMVWLAERFASIEKRKKESAGEDATDGLLDELRRKRRQERGERGDKPNQG